MGGCENVEIGTLHEKGTLHETGTQHEKGTMHEKGMLHGVSVGPGDPELMTLKAVRILREADVVAVPDIGHKRQTAFSIAWEHLEGKELLDCSTPMTRDREAVRRAYDAVADSICHLLDQGKDVAYITLGDATVYSTYMYVHNLVRSRGYSVQVVPGVTSFCAAAARLQVPLCEGDERLLVAPVLSDDEDDVDEVLGYRATKVLMKTGKRTGSLQERLKERGLAERSCAVANCGLPDEAVYPDLSCDDVSQDYFSVVIVRNGEGDGGRHAQA